MTPFPFHVDPQNKDEPDELSVQVKFRNAMRTRAPRVMLVAVPNSGKRTAWEVRQRSKEGMHKGFPDMIAFFDGGVACLEFKSGSGAIKSDQIEVLNALVRRNIQVGVFRTAESAVEFLRRKWPHAFTGEA